MTNAKTRPQMTPARVLATIAVIVSSWILLAIPTPARAATEKFATPGLDLYVDEYGNFNLGIPGESSGLFYNYGLGNPGVAAGEAGLAVYLYQLSGAAGIGQGVPFTPVSGPQVVSETADMRVIETRFTVQEDPAMLDVTQEIVQLKGTRTVLITYEMANAYGDDLVLRPYLVGDLRLDEANSALSTYTPSPVPILTVASTTTPRSIAITSQGDHPISSAQVGDWESIAQSYPGSDQGYDVFNANPTVNPAFGLEWDPWSTSTLSAGEIAIVSVAMSVTTGEPQRGVSAVAQPLSGTVLIKAPGGSFEALQPGQDVPIGSLVDTRQGTIRLTTEGQGGSDQTAKFRDGLFRLVQKRSSPLTTLKLQGPLVCGSRSRLASGDSTAQRRGRGGRSLWGSGKGKFRTSGKRGSGSVRGTTWQVTDRCDGSTQIKSINGRVEARDVGRPGFKRLLLSGQSYVARPRR